MVDPSAETIFSQYIQTHYLVLDEPEIPKSDGVQKEKMILALDTSHPEKNVVNFEESREIVQLKGICPNAYQLPIESDPYRNLALLQRKLSRTERQLRATRKRLKIEKTNAGSEWRALEEKEDQLRENFISFNEFVEENKEKRVRARKKIDYDQTMIKEKQNDISRMSAEIVEMQKLRALLETNLKKFSAHKHFLERVLETSGEFHFINDILNRYQNLVEAKRLLAVTQKEDMDILQNAKGQMLKLIEEKNFAIMGLNNQIANLQARYENANIKALESEGLVTQIKNNAVKRLREIDSVKNSIWNVYVHMASSKKHPIKIKKNHVEDQMMYINRTLTELYKVNKIIKRKAIIKANK